MSSQSPQKSGGSRKSQNQDAAEAAEPKKKTTIKQEENEESMFRRIFKLLRIPIAVLVVAVFVAFLKNKLVEGMHTSSDCVGWEGSGSCKKCTTSIGKWYEISKFFQKNIRASCSQCPSGFAKMSGTPSKSQKFKTPQGDSFKWDNHCAEFAMGDERHVLMIRHGESTWNSLMEKSFKTASIVGMVVGTDAPLNAKGLMQASRFGNILKKASSKVYGASDDKSDQPLIEASSELSKINYEAKMVITDTHKATAVTDDVMVENLVKPDKRLMLDVLTGRKCAETEFVSSPLTRAYDTMLIACMERFQRCKTPWLVSSNLQEIEHNADCHVTLEPGAKPSLTSTQHDQYEKAGIPKTREYVEAMYKKFNTSRHGTTKSALARVRLFDQSPQMKAEIEETFASPKKFHVWAGHSIWFRVFFQYFADYSNLQCKALTNMKVANTAVVSMKLRRLKNSPWEYAATECTFIHLGNDREFKMKGGKSEL